MKFRRFILKLLGSFICVLIAMSTTAVPVSAADSELVVAQAAITEKEAYDAAKELGTLEAWEAFLLNYPKGFLADLARAYVKNLANQMETKNPPAQTAAPTLPPAPVQSAPVAQPAAPVPPPTPVFQPLDRGPGASPWQNRNRVLAVTGNQQLYTASVQGQGVEIVTYCRDWSRTGGTGHGLYMVMRENPRGAYPDFDARIRQAMSQAPSYLSGKKVQLHFSNGKSFNDITFQDRIVGGEVEIGDSNQAISQGLAFNEILGANTMTISAPPFSATFQLKGSRAAICRVFQSCGAKRPECARFAPKPVVAKPRLTIPKKRRKSGCRSGTVFLEGQCIPKSQVTSFCGPGFRRVGTKCVHQNDLVPQ